MVALLVSDGRRTRRRVRPRWAGRVDQAVSLVLGLILAALAGSVSLVVGLLVLALAEPVLRALLGGG